MAERAREKKNVVDVAAVVVGLLWSRLVRDDGCEAVV
jgi:hypothetical protein